jgi:hypothetical protein
MTIILTSDIESALTEEARKQGTTAEELALQCLRTRFVPAEGGGAPPQGQETLADFLADHIGVLASAEYVPGGARMSEDSGKKFATGLIQKRQQGRL